MNYWVNSAVKLNETLAGVSQAEQSLIMMIVDRMLGC